MHGYRTCVLALLLVSGSVEVARATTFADINLVSDIPGAAPITDPALKNAWGIAGSGTSPFWVGDNGTGLSTLYAVDPNTGAVTKNALEVTIPGAGSVTGVARGGVAGSFNGDSFLFVSEDGTISGWRNTLGTSAEVLAVGSAANVYKGTAFATIGGSGYLYSANFSTGAIDVLKGNAAAANLTGNFTDPNIPAGFAPFNIKVLNGNLFVTYAKQSNPFTGDELDGAGLGFVDEYDLQGNFLGRIASQGPLNAPWGLAVAPTAFGDFAGDLLVGNFGDGTINAFNLATDTFVGTLRDPGGNPLVIDGLWSLVVGGGAGTEGSNQKIYFTAGPNGEADGVFGVIESVPEPNSIAMFGFALVFLGFLSRQRQRVN
ncbi:MAG TPA: TIGR03118 family protein [Micropepsaceae bacterium]|nr:TIGR03118 family protein [Micropepsaceae bacterium]